MWVIALRYGPRSACRKLRCRRHPRQPLHPRRMWRNYVDVLTHRILLLAFVPALEFRGVLHLCRAGAYVSDRQARRVDLGIRVPVHPADRRRADRRVGVGSRRRAVDAAAHRRPGLRVHGRRRSGQHRHFGLRAAQRVLEHPTPIFAFTIGSSIVAPSVTLLLLDLAARPRPSSLRDSCNSRCPGLTPAASPAAGCHTADDVRRQRRRLHCRELRAMEPLPPRRCQPESPSDDTHLAALAFLAGIRRLDIPRLGARRCGGAGTSTRGSRRSPSTSPGTRWWPKSPPRRRRATPG